MKPLTRSLGALVLFVSTLVACSSNGDASPGGSEPLSVAETQSLTFTREEEKLARDVYAALGDKDGVFANVESSEQTHMDAILTLLSRYSLPDPAEGKAFGAFTDPALQKLYDDLVAQGAASSLAALKVGVAIEELDIRDIEAARTSVTHSDVLTTFDNLTRGSRNHLRSFYGRVQALGGTYSPQYLDAATFQAIVDAPMETGPNR